MFKENTQYYTLTDIINTAISKSFQANKKKDTSDLSLHIINDMTYSNIWAAFVKWCTDQAELGFLLSIYPLGTMYYIVDKQFEGISIKISEVFLKENDLKWDDSKFYYEKLPEVKFNSTVATVQKLNLLAISSELNLPKIYVQAGLNNLFKSIAYLLTSASSSCLIDLGFLGNLHCNNKMVYHIPSKLKKETVFNKRTTIKTLMGKYNEEEMTTKEANQTEGKEGKFGKVSNLNVNLINHKMPQIEDNLNVNSINDRSFLNKLRGSIKIAEGHEKLSFDMLPSPIRRSVVASSGRDQTGVIKPKEKVVLIPIREQDWHLKDMLHSTFKRSDRHRRSNSPVLFNAYSNTKAAPFTSEKTQIPISHRIGSFYSLPLQNFIINKTTKSIKRLFEEYFYKYKNIIFDIPATEEEEYLAHIKAINIDPAKVALRWETYKRYQAFIYQTIQDDVISEIKEEWLFSIVKMCLRAYNLNSQERYSELLNACIREIILSYKISMKKSILDYVLKHPELREKLGIPVPFRKLKEYAEAVVKRPSDENTEWKRNWNLSKVRISNNLMIVCQNVTKILKYYTNNLKSTTFLDLTEKDWTAVQKLTSFVDTQKAKIEDQRNFISEDWKKYVEGVLKENKIYKDQLILYFKSVSGLMSTQLRNLVIGSLEKYHKFIKRFDKTSYASPNEVFENQFNPNFPFERSFIEIEIIPSSDGTSFDFSDDLGEVHTKLSGIVNEIVKSSQDVERPDNMFIKNLDKRANLWEVPINDIEVATMMYEIDHILKSNLDVVNKVTELYKPFEFILTGQAALEKFKLTNPKREEIKKQVKAYEDSLKVLREDMPNALYMNMIKIDCTEINRNLRESLNYFIVDLLKYVQVKNIIGKSKELNDKIEKLKSELQSHATDEETLAHLMNNLDLFKNEQIPHLYSEYNDFLEWVFFYLEYDTYPVPESGKEIIGGIETHIKTTHSTVKLIPQALDNFESHLKEKHSQLEVNLNKVRASVNNKITALRKDVEAIRENAQLQLGQDDSGASTLLQLKQLEKRIQEAGVELKNLIKKEELMGSYPTEDERVELCQKDLEQMISYFTFYNEYKNIHLDFDSLEIRHIEFSHFMSMIERSYEIFDSSQQKMPVSMKNKISKFKADFDNFKSAVEIAKLIFTVVDIYKFEHIATDNPALFDDNFAYCQEIVKVIYPEKDTSKANEYLKNLKFKELLRHYVDKSKVHHKVEIEKIVHDWEAVRNLYDILSRIANEMDMEFETENLKDKKYLIVTHESFLKVKTMLNKNIKEVDDNLSSFEHLKEEIKIIKKVTDFKTKLTELLDIVVKFESVQLLLEKHMAKANILLKISPNDWFINLREADSKLKDLIEFIAKQRKVLKILAAAEVFRSTIAEVDRILGEIPNKYDDKIE